jgi:hypothetical protein
LFELREPGSFGMCANPEWEAEARTVLRAVARSVPTVLVNLEPLGIILTGSLSRGEGTLARDTDQTVRWLSDLECLVVFRDSCSMSPRVQLTLEAAATELADQLRGRATGLKIHLGGIRARALAKMRPSIFRYELAKNGKLIWGNSAEIPRVAESDCDASNFHLDALRLLTNRIIELIPARLALEAGKQPPSGAYALNKLWLDAGTSLAVFLNCYRASYADRARALGIALNAPGHTLELRTAREVAERVSAATNVKLGFASMNPRVTELDFKEAVRIAADIWYWQTSQVLSDGPRPQTFDWCQVIRRVRRLQTFSQQLRDCARFAIRRRATGIPALGGLSQVVRAGSPRSAIFGAGCLVQFFWDELVGDYEPGMGIARAVGELLGMRRESRSATRRQLAERTFSLWECHVRDHPL